MTVAKGAKIAQDTLNNRMLKKLVLFAVLAGSLACASASAKAPPERPALEVPPPPPRAIEPVVVSEPEQPEPVADLPAPPPATPRPRPQPKDTARDQGKSEAKPETPSEQPVAPPAVAPAPPQSQLRTPGTADAAEAARQVREVLDRTTRMLNTIDYRVLSSERQKAYNEAKEFMRGAEAAIKESNYVFARSLADKAEKLAKEIQTR
jgi:hypothetical protein